MQMQNWTEYFHVHKLCIQLCNHGPQTQPEFWLFDKFRWSNGNDYDEIISLECIIRNLIKVV